MIDYLIGFYVNARCPESEAIGFVSGEAGVDTYMIENMPERAATETMEQLKRQLGLPVRHTRSEEANRKTMILFDSSPENLREAFRISPELEELVTKISVLPKWAKDCLL